MIFGNSFNCHTCHKDIDVAYHRYHCDIAGIDLEFFTHPGDCDKKFRGEYVDPFVEPEDEPILDRSEILDLRRDEIQNR